MQFWIKTVQQDEGAIISRLLKSSNNEQDAQRKRAVAEKKRAEKRLAELDNLIAKIYEDRVSEVITARNFSMLSQKYQQEQEQLEAKISDLEIQLDAYKEQTANVERWVGLMKQYTDLNELTVEVLNTLIDKILIHEAIKHPDKTREQEIEIYYRFVGNIDQSIQSISLTA